MPVYEVTDPASKVTLELTGDSPPTEAELESLFSKESLTKIYTPGVEAGMTEANRLTDTVLKTITSPAAGAASEMGRAQGENMRWGKSYIAEKAKLETAQRSAAVEGAIAEQQANAVDFITGKTALNAISRSAEQLPDLIAAGADIPGRIGASLVGNPPPEPRTGEDVKRFLEAAQKPIVALPKFTEKADDSFIKAASKEAANLLVGIPEFIESPMGIATAGVGAAGKIGAAVVRYGFAADMVKSLFQQYPQIKENWDGMTQAQKGRAIAQFIGTGAMAALLAKTDAKSKDALVEKTEKLSPDEIRLTPQGPSVYGAEALPLPMESGKIAAAGSIATSPSDELQPPVVADVPGRVLRTPEGYTVGEVLTPKTTEALGKTVPAKTPEVEGLAPLTMEATTKEAPAVKPAEVLTPLTTDALKEVAPKTELKGEETNATIPQRSSETAIVGETPGYSEKVGERVPTPEETANAQAKAQEVAPPTPDRVYDQSLEAFRAASREFTKAQKAYRAREIGDDEFLASRKKFDQASAIAYKAERDYIESKNAEATPGVSVPAPETDVSAPQPQETAPETAKSAPQPKTLVEQVKAPESTAIRKVKAEVQKVAATEGQRPAKEVKNELVSRLEAAIKEAPNASDVEPKTHTLANMKRVTSEDQRTKITIDIPGDGTFTVWNTKENLTELLKRAKKISTSTTPLKGYKETGISREDKRWVDEQIRKPSQESAPEMIGMGGALEGEVGSGYGKDIYGIAERVRKQRSDAGQVAEIPPGKGISAPDSVERGRNLLSEGVDPDISLKEFETTGKLSADDMAVVRAHGEELAKAARNIEQKFGTETPEYMMAWKSLSDWDARSKAMQTEWHKMGQAQQGETDIDTGSFTGLQRAHKEATGKDFTKNQEYSAKSIANRVSDVEAAADAAKQRLANEIARDPTIEPVVKSIADRIINALDDSAKKALDRIKARRAEGRLFAAGVDPEQLKDYAIYGAAKMSKGVLKFGKWSAEMVNEIGDYIKPHLDQIWELSTKHLDEITAKESAEEPKPEPKTAKKSAAQDEAGRVWAKTKEYLDKGEDDFDDIRNKVATDLGMKVDDVTKTLASTKRAKYLADDLWKKQQQSRRVKEQAKRWLRNVEMPAYERAIASIPKLMFAVRVGFHGTVALGTHAPAVAFQPQFWHTYVKDFLKMYRMVGSPAYYERQVQDLVRRPNYISARRAGLVNDPYQYEEYHTSPLVGKIQEKFPTLAETANKVTTMGNRGYAVLKILRQDMFDQMWNGLPESAKLPEVASAIADGLNHATGVVKGKAPPGSNIALFAPRLLASRGMWLAGDPIRATRAFLNWNNASVAEKTFAINQVKEKATVIGTMASMLALNQGILSATGSNQQINVTDPFRSDFLKFKAAGMNISYGNPMITLARLPLKLFLGIKNERRLSKLIYEDENVAKTLFDYGRSQLSPFASLVTDLAIGRDFEGRPLPRAGFGMIPGKTNMTKRLIAEGKKPYTWTEFWTQQSLPIPFQEAAREVWGKMGMSKQDQDHYLKAWAIIAFMAATGGRMSDDYTIEPGFKPYQGKK